MQKISCVTYFNEEECIVYSLLKFAWEIISLSFSEDWLFQVQEIKQTQHRGSQMSIRRWPLSPPIIPSSLH